MKMLKIATIALMLSLLMSLAASAQAPQLKTLTLTAWIDGRDLLYITPDSIHWHHLDFAAVGRLGGQNLPTGLFMNKRGPSTLHFSWIPDWPCQQWECRGEEVDSSSFALVVPLPAQYQLTGFKVIRARDSASVYQYPDLDNQYTTIIDFNDDPGGGADWYTVTLTFAPASGSPESHIRASSGADRVAVKGTPLAPEGLVTIYSNLGTGDQVYNCCTALTSSGPSSPLSETVEVANAFTPTADFTITQVQGAFGYAIGTNAVTVSIRSDNNGVPGAILKQWYPKRLSSLGTCCNLATKNFSEGIPVTGGTQYWLVVRQCVASSDAWNGWNLNSNNASGPFAIKVSGGHFVNQGIRQQGAFGIFGQ